MCWSISCIASRSGATSGSGERAPAVPAALPAGDDTGAGLEWAEPLGDGGAELLASASGSWSRGGEARRGGELRRRRRAASPPHLPDSSRSRQRSSSNELISGGFAAPPGFGFSADSGPRTNCTIGVASSIRPTSFLCRHIQIHDQNSTINYLTI